MAQPLTLPAGAWGPTSAVELTGDTFTDLLVGSAGGDAAVAIATSDGNSLSAATAQYAAANCGVEVFAALRDAEPSQRTVFVPGNCSEPPSSVAAKVFVGVGDGTLSEVAAPQVMGRVSHFAMGGTFDGDGMADLVIGGPDLRVELLLGRADGGLEAATALDFSDACPLCEAMPVGVVGDVDGDGRTELVASTSDGQSIQLRTFFGLGGTVSSTTIGQSDVPLLIADFNDDSVGDLLIRSDASLIILLSQP